MIGRKLFPRLFKLKFITKKGKFVKGRKIKRLGLRFFVVNLAASILSYLIVQTP